MRRIGVKIYGLLCKVFFTLILCLYTFVSFAQLDTSFWFVAPEVSQHNNPNNFDRPIKLVVSSMQNIPTTVTVSQPANSNFTPIQQTVPPMGNVSINLTNFIASIETSPVNSVLNTGLHLVSSQPVNVYYEIGLTGVNPEVFALKGRNALGTTFVMPGQNEFMNGDTYSPTPYNRLDIVATQNGTTVTIVPSVAIQGHAVGVPFNVTLDAGQTYSCAATGRQPSNHFLGTIITSTQPIAVTVSDDLLHHPSGGQDLVGDQIVPIGNTGTEFIAVKGALYQNADKVYITAIQNNTQIFVDGDATAITMLNAGNTYAIPFATNSQTLYITTNNPVYAFQLTGLGREFGGAVLPSVSHTGSQCVSYTRGGNASRILKFNIITRDGNQNNFTLNGNNSVITSNLFAPVYGTNGSWVYASVELPVSVVNINSTAIVSNSGLFHLGVFEGGYQDGCSYAYFSDYQKYLTTDAEMYVACAGETIDINIATIGIGQVVNWFQTAQSDVVIHTGNSYTVTKNADSIQYVYAQLYDGSEPYGDRLRIPILLTTLCGDSIEESCEGTVLFYQDFGGNEFSDPWVSPIDFIGGHSELMFSGTGAVSGHYALLKKCTDSWAVHPNYDHTHEGNQEQGYMMYLDPGPNQMNSVLYEMSINGLCDNAKLNFSFWATDLQRNYAHPMFEMQLINPQDSSVLVKSAIITVPRNNPLVWHQYGFPFILPNNIDDVVFRIINKNVDNIGNDWAIDDIKVTYCGGIASIITPTTDTIVCEEESIRFVSQFVISDNSLMGATMEYEWQYSANGIDWQTLANSNSPQYLIPLVSENHVGYYRVHVAGVDLLETPCSFYSDHVQLMVDNCVFSACDTTYILDTIYYGQRYTENGFDIVCNQNTLIGLNVYEQTLQNEDGCDSLVYLILNILCPEKKRANTITPSVQDGLNDVFMPFGEEMNPYSTVYIYNRWGKLVHKENVTTPVYWDGKVNGQVSSGTFYYVIEMSNGCAYHGTLTVM